MNRVDLAPRLLRDVKRLRKKYPNVQADVQSLISTLEQGEVPGDQVPGVGYTVYKVRVRSSDQRKGKRGGFRVLYYLRTTTLFILLTLYAKSDRIDISPEQIRYLIEEYNRLNLPP